MPTDRPPYVPPPLPPLGEWLPRLEHPHLNGPGLPLELLDAHRRRLAWSVAAVCCGPGAGLWLGTLPGWAPVAWAVGVLGLIWGSVGLVFAVLPLRLAQAQERQSSDFAALVDRLAEQGGAAIIAAYTQAAARVYGPPPVVAPDPGPVINRGDRVADAPAPTLPPERPERAAAALEPGGGHSHMAATADAYWDGAGPFIVLAIFADEPYGLNALTGRGACDREGYDAASTAFTAAGLWTPRRGQPPALGPVLASVQGKGRICRATGGDAVQGVEAAHTAVIGALAGQSATLYVRA